VTVRGTGAGRRGGFIREVVKQPASYLLMLPAIIYTFVYGYATMPYLVSAFQKFSYRTNLFTAEWNGLKNFEFFFQSQRAWMVTFNTLRLNLLFIVFGTLFALFIAVLLSELRARLFVKVAQSTYLFPHFVSWVIASYIMYSIFGTTGGLLNRLLESVGLEARNWYADPDPWPRILLGLNIWKHTGMRTVIYLAAIAAIDPQLYEAATIDGATRFQQMVRITLPHLYPVVAILTLLSLGRIFYADFGMIYTIVRDNGLLYETTDVIDTYVFRALRRHGDPAQAMAVNLYQAVFGFTLVYVSNWVARKFFPEGALY
jgi:putative aldouronate transport system permease protein